MHIFFQTLKNIFHSKNDNNNYLVRLITDILSRKLLNHEENFTLKLQILARSHYKLGVKSNEYGILGEALFYTLNKCLGPGIYTEIIHTTWIKIYSRMLFFILPLALNLESAFHFGQNARVMIDSSKNEEFIINNSCPFGYVET